MMTTSMQYIEYNTFSEENNSLWMKHFQPTGESKMMQNRN